VRADSSLRPKDTPTDSKTKFSWNWVWWGGWNWSWTYSGILWDFVKRNL